MTDNENSTKLPNRGAPKGTRHYSGFDELVDGLLRASLAGRCMLTAGKDRTADELRPIGSLIDLLERLKPYLPNDRMPSNVETLLGAVDRRKAEMHYAELHAWLASEQKIGCQTAINWRVKAARKSPLFAYGTKHPVWEQSKWRTRTTGLQKFIYGLTLT